MHKCRHRGAADAPRDTPDADRTQGHREDTRDAGLWSTSALSEYISIDRGAGGRKQ